MDKWKDKIERYHRGELSRAEMHELEMKALSDPFLADALEGAETILPEEFAKDVAELQSKTSAHKSVFFTPLRIAAGLILIATAVTFVLLNQSDDQKFTSKLDKNFAPTPEEDSASSKKKSDSIPLLTLNDQKKEVAQQQPQTSKPSSRKRNASPDLNNAAEEVVADKDIIEEQGITAADAAAIESEKAVTQVIAKDSVRVASPAPNASRSAGEANATGFVSVLKAPAQKTITGKVIAQEDGLPMPGVNVVVKGKTIGTVTDLDGNYAITAPADAALQFSFIGMITTEVDSKDKQKVDVTLAEDVSQLTEVVVTGAATPKPENQEPVIRLASPVGGMKSYNKYLDDNLQYPKDALDNNVKGRVIVEFTVGTSGDVGDFTVVKGIGFGCDDEVIRLVKEGPKWNPTTEDNVAVESSVRVRMKFDPAKAGKR